MKSVKNLSAIISISLALSIPSCSKEDYELSNGMKIPSYNVVNIEENKGVRKFNILPAYGSNGVIIDDGKGVPYTFRNVTLFDGGDTSFGYYEKTNKVTYTSKEGREIPIWEEQQP